MLGLRHTVQLHWANTCSWFSLHFSHYKTSEWTWTETSLLLCFSSLIYIFHSTLDWSVEKNISFCCVVLAVEKKMLAFLYFVVKCFCFSLLLDLFTEDSGWWIEFCNNAETNLLYYCMYKMYSLFTAIMFVIFTLKIMQKGLRSLYSCMCLQNIQL